MWLSLSPKVIQGCHDFISPPRPHCTTYAFESNQKGGNRAILAKTALISVTMADSVSIDPVNFCKRLKKLFDHWKVDVDM